MIKDTNNGKTNFCSHETSNTSGICDFCLGKWDKKEEKKCWKDSPETDIRVEEGIHPDYCQCKKCEPLLDKEEWWSKTLKLAYHAKYLELDNTYGYIPEDLVAEWWLSQIKQAEERGYASGCSNPNYNDGYEFAREEIKLSYELFPEVSAKELLEMGKIITNQ